MSPDNDDISADDDGEAAEFYNSLPEEVKEEIRRKLEPEYRAALKRIKQRQRLSAVEDLAEPMMQKLFAGDLECVDSLPPIPTLDEDEQETERRVHELEQHEKAIIKQHGKYDELADEIERWLHIKAKRQKEQEQ
jgi:hypothetical protein